MGGGGVRSEETGQPARRTRGTKGDAIMRGASRWKAVERGEATRQPSGREAWEGRDEWPESSVRPSKCIQVCITDDRTLGRDRDRGGDLCPALLLSSKL